MTSHVHHVTIDCADAYELGSFWARVLGGSLADDDLPGDPEALLETPGAALLFVTVPEPKRTKNRVHFDVMPDRTRDEEVERLLALGATVVGDHRRPNGRGWVTLADPEGNEFCVECGAEERARLTGTRQPVTADDVTATVALCVETLGAAADRDWHVPAGDLTWDCWETVDHLQDDLFSYAVQLAPGTPSLETHVPYHWAPRREGGPWNAVWADPETGVAGLLKTVETGGALLSAMVRTTPPATRSFHSYGPSDPEGFAAMGIVETLVHTQDVAAGLSLTWAPPQDLCDRVLARLFPDAPEDEDRWAVLLWCTGRTALPGHERRTSWKWRGAPPEEAPQA
ncbi:VOC family protein [Streptomyces sp. NPDC059783]|uniref:VOC family protein n=1 Tax=Streptomyces sp. NPDC059783 TaxID=3346944 RepID=UPI0036656473